MSFIVGQKVISASGGTISTTTGYIVHTFTSSGTFTPSQNGTVEVLVVGAGGSNGTFFPGAFSGGGGGGSVIYRKFTPVGAGVSYTVEIGQVATPLSTASTITHPQGPITAPGGGAGSPGSGGPATSNPVGSGGGGAFGGLAGDGANVIGLGFSGGPTSAGGGGGAGGLGFSYSGPTGTGNGGIGVSYSITGTSNYYGAGGGGAGNPNNNISLPIVSIYGRGGRGSTTPLIPAGPGIVIIRYIN